MATINCIAFFLEGVTERSGSAEGARNERLAVFPIFPAEKIVR